MCVGLYRVNRQKGEIGEGARIFFTGEVQARQCPTEESHKEVQRAPKDPKFHQQIHGANGRQVHVCRSETRY